MVLCAAIVSGHWGFVSADAVEHAGQECIVEFNVASSRLLEGKGSCFLNSQKDHRENGNFSAVIFRAGLDLFAAKGIADTAQEYLDKKIRVSGRIEERAGQAQIVIEGPTQITVVPADGDVTDDGQDR